MGTFTPCGTGKLQALRRAVGQRGLWSEDPELSVSCVEFCQHRVEELQHCMLLPAPRHAATCTARIQCIHTSMGLGCSCPVQHKAQHPTGWEGREDAPGPTAACKAQQEAHQRGAQRRKRLGMLKSPQGYSQAKITHHRLHAVFWLCSPLLLSDSSIF